MILQIADLVFVGGVLCERLISIHWSGQLFQSCSNLPDEEKIIAIDH